MSHGLQWRPLNLLILPCTPVLGACFLRGNTARPDVVMEEPFGTDANGIGQSPSKRWRVSDELDHGHEAHVISLTVRSRDRDDEQEDDVSFLWYSTGQGSTGSTLPRYCLRCTLLSETGHGALLCSCGVLPSVVAHVSVA